MRNLRHVVVYIAGPYRASTEWELVQNIRHAEHYAIKYWSAGYTVICPHKNTAHFGGSQPDEVWLEGTLEMLRRSDILVLIPGWEKSSGSKAERDEAMKLNKQIIYEE